MFTPGVLALLNVYFHLAAAQSVYDLWSFAVATTGGDVQVIKGTTLTGEIDAQLCFQQLYSSIFNPNN